MNFKIIFPVAVVAYFLKKSEQTVIANHHASMVLPIFDPVIKWKANVHTQHLECHYSLSKPEEESPYNFKFIS